MKGKFDNCADGRVVLHITLNKKESFIGKRFIDYIIAFNKRERMQFAGQGTVRINGERYCGNELKEFTIEEPFPYKEKKKTLYTIRERITILCKGAL